jgi:hypothetical protein
VEAADGQALEFEVARAIDNFVLGCKADGIWDAIKASCILAGARTLTGALVPLAGTAPTNFNFVSSDYNRKTGLAGDGSTKYLDSNRTSDTDPLNSKHCSVYISTTGTAESTDIYLGDTTTLRIAQSATTSSVRVSSIFSSVATAVVTGFVGGSRSISGSFIARRNGANVTQGATSSSDVAKSTYIFARNDSPPLNASARLAFYSIGESLNLALLDARVTDLINAFDTAIPS